MEVRVQWGKGGGGVGWGGGVYQLQGAVRVQGGGEGEGATVGLYSFPLTGAQVPITNYTCTQPNLPGFNDNGQCTVSDGLRTCAIKEGARPALLNSSTSLSTHGFYGWDSSRPPYPNPFVALDIPQGWCVGSVRMMFVGPSNIPILSLSVHSAERLSTITDRTVFSLVSEEGTRLVVMNLTALACGKYLRINMTSTGRLFLTEIEVFDTGKCTNQALGTYTKQ